MGTVLGDWVVKMSNTDLVNFLVSVFGRGFPTGLSGKMGRWSKQFGGAQQGGKESHVVE